MNRIRYSILSALLIAAALANAAYPAESAPAIAPQPLISALNEFVTRTGMQVVYRSELATGIQSKGADSGLPPQKMLEQLLRDTGLLFEFVNSQTVTIRAAKSGSNEPSAAARGTANGLHLAQADTAAAVGGEADEPGEKKSGGIPEILVKGARSLNLDIERSRDDTQPYVVFDRATIERSSAQSVQEFLQTRLTSATYFGNSQQSAVGENRSQVTLRGLGQAQTLILVDGHRIAAQNSVGTAGQPDLNGIPLSAIERIEVLPTTAAGIYGGSATGGVVNVILRHDYAGAEGKLTYGNSFDGGGAQRRFDFSAGDNFNAGKTNLMLSGSYSDADPLFQRDRDYIRRGRENPLVLAQIDSSVIPPLGYTTNIRSLAGPLTFKSAFGGGAVGSVSTYVPVGYAGPASDNGAQLIANAGLYNLDLADTRQPQAANQALFNGPTVWSLRATARHQFTETLQGFVEGMRSENHGSFPTNNISGGFFLSSAAAGNPFDQNIYITTPAFGTDGEAKSDSNVTRFVAGAILKLPGSWHAEADFTWDRNYYFQQAVSSSLTTQGFTQISSGALNVFRDTNRYPIDLAPYLTIPTTVTPTNNVMRGIALRFAGELPFMLPGGAPKLSTLLEHRQEVFDDYSTVSADYGTFVYGPEQRIKSAYLEANLPLVSGKNALPGVHALELLLSGRRDDYKLFGTNSVDLLLPSGVPADPELRARSDFSSADYTVSLKYEPLAGLAVRGSYGTGFTPPSLAQLVPSPPLIQFDASIFGVQDPKRGDELITVVDYYYGGSGALRPEKSKSSSLGVIFQPAFASGLRASVDWVRIDKKDNVTSFGLLPETMAIEDLLPPDIIVRGPPSGGYPVGPVIRFNGFYVNALSQRVEAIDYAVDYQFDRVLGGALSVGAAATNNLKNNSQTLPGLPGIESAGTSGYLSLIGNAHANYERGPWAVGWTMRYLSSYYINPAHTPLASQGGASIPSQSYHDVMARYRFERDTGGRLLSNTEVQLSISNVLNKRPPYFLAAPYLSPQGDVRLGMYYLSIRKAFD